MKIMMWSLFCFNLFLVYEAYNTGVGRVFIEAQPWLFVSVFLNCLVALISWTLRD